MSDEEFADEELDFGTVFGLSEVVVVKPKPWMADKTFTLVGDVVHLRKVIDAAIEAGFCALDLETEGFDNRIKDDGTTVHKIVGYCLSYDGEEGFYVPVRHAGEGVEANLDSNEVVKEIARLCEKCITIYHNAVFDHEFLFGEGIHINSHTSFEDTLILDYLRDSSDKRHGLKHLSERFLGMEMIGLKELFSEKVKDYNFASLDPTKEQVLWYAGSDAICTYLLFQFYRDHAYKPVGKGEGGETVFGCVPVGSSKEPSIYESQPFPYYIERINVPALRWMERNRPLIDLDYIGRVRGEVQGLIDQIKESISSGFHDNNVLWWQLDDVSSTTKLGVALEQMVDEGRLKVKLQRTDKGAVQTDETTIHRLAAKVGKEFPFLAKITTFNKLQKVDGTYLRPLQENTDGFIPEDGVRNVSHVLNDNSIRFSFLPNRVDTGRYSASKGKPDQGYSGINAQSIPATYNVGKFSGKAVHSRPQQEGEKDAPLYDNFLGFYGGDYLIRLYDNHFVFDPLEDQEYCVRKSCEGCPFADDCDHDPEPEDGATNVKILSLDSSVRPAIIAREGYSIAAIDQSGVELRVAASISQEPKWIEEFYRCSKCSTEYDGPVDLTPDKPLGQKSYKVPVRPPSTCVNCGSDKIGDLHTLTTKIVFGDDVTKKPDFKQYRQKAKGANFAILYGGSGGAVARSTGVSREEGTHIRKKFLDGLPRLNRWFREVIQRTKVNKQVTTGCARLLRLGDIDHSEGWISSKAERNAVNGIIQGTATGDLTKYCMGRVYQHFYNNDLLDKCRLILTVHDELVFEIRNDLMPTVFPQIVEIMTELGDKMKWAVPLSCDVEFGPSFHAAHNWYAMTSVNGNTGRAEDPVPKYLWNRIEMKPGMWYIDDEGNEVVIEGEPEPEPEPAPEPEPEAEPEPEVSEPPPKKPLAAPSPQREDYMTIKKGRSSSERAKFEGPVFEFQLESGPALYNGNNPRYIRVLMRSLFQIFDFFKSEGTGSYALHLMDWQGETIIHPSEKHLVDPDEFEVLVRFLGIYGARVR